jgi:MFS transporter, FSR family, fosmidomycin resistance protein
VGLAHGTSHFFHLLLPPLFPVFAREFGVSFTQLGLLVSVFFVVSAVGQAVSGFVVDRVGAKPALFAALACFVGAALATAAASGMTGLVLAAALAGLGNAPFHPADYTVLNRRVSKSRLGHAYSIHGVSGTIGWALAPVVLLGLSSITGSWRQAFVIVALWPALVLALLVWQRDAIDDRLGPAGGESGAAASSTSLAGKPAGDEHALAFLKLPAVWLCFSFFFWYTVALAAVQSFGGPALHALHGIPIEVASFVVTGFMACSAVGMLVGGFLTARDERLERVVAVCFGWSALLLSLTAWAALPAWAALATASLAGLGTGMAGPSRDMLIKQSTPPGATGRVYGTVYSGLDVGFAVSAPVFGALIDRGMAQGGRPTTYRRHRAADDNLARS